MNRPSIYLDYNASAPVRPQAREAVARALETAGNPSAVHAAGRAARAITDDAREAVAALLSVAPEQVTFVSGGTEANAQAVTSAVRAGSRRLIVSAGEHPCVAKTAEASGAPVEVWPVNRDGRVEIAWLDERLARWDEADGPPFVALTAANNVTGVLQPVAEAGERVRAAGGWLHVDAVQAAGKIPLNLGEMGATTVSIAAHKLGGPQGVGALIHAPGAAVGSIILGGEQERGLRAGTLNVPGIAGLGAAALASARDLGHAAEYARWRDAAEARLTEHAGIVVFGRDVPRLPNTSCFGTEGFAADRQMMGLDLAGVMVSAGSACSSGRMKPIAVLEQMGFGDLAGCAIRVSGGWGTSEQEWEAFADAWLEAWRRHAARRAPVREYA